MEKVLQAGLLAPFGPGAPALGIYPVRDREILKKMSECREGGAAKMLAGADSAVVVIADPEKTDVWTEDCSIAMAYMHLAADSLGLGSCWIQGRLRNAPDGRTTEEYLRDLLGFPESFGWRRFSLSACRKITRHRERKAICPRKKYTTGAFNGEKRRRKEPAREAEEKRRPAPEKQERGKTIYDEHIYSELSGKYHSGDISDRVRR